MKTRKCVGCGYCCMKTPCDAARRLYMGVTQCPQLIWKEDSKRYVCGLMTLPGNLGFEYRKELHAGEGCCSGLNSWRQDVKQRVSVEATYVNPIPSIMQIFIRALSCQFISGDTMSLTLSHMENDMKQSGYAQNEIDNIINGIIRAFSENRSKFTEEFMG